MRRAPGMGQVLIEMALATVGVVVIAFVMARAANWLNRSMVQRNQSFQNTRVAAARSAGLVRVAAPSQINLIGPGAARGGGAGSQPASSYDRSCPAGTGFYNQATTHRQQADDCMREGEAQRKQGMDLSNDAARLVGVANVLEQFRRDINTCVAELTSLSNQYTACDTALQQCNQSQTNCNTDCTNCRNGCAITQLGCVVGCGSATTALGKAVCIAGCRNVHDNTCVPGCDAQYCNNSTCTASCGDCNALKTQTANKYAECTQRMQDRDAYCGTQAARFGVVLTCDKPQSALTAANGKMGQVNSHIAQARNRARCVYNQIGEAEDAERKAVRACARR